MIFPQFLASLSEWVSAADIRRHKALVRELYVRGFTAEDAGDFLFCYVNNCAAPAH